MASEEHTVVHYVEKPDTRIPPDFIEEILLRLPISSLLKLRRVCKQWRNMISDPHFIMEHAYRAPKHLLLYLPKVDLPASLCSKTLKCRATIIDEKWSPWTWAALHMDPDDHLFASCNGLLCFYKTYTLKIANPATGQCLHLLKPDGIMLHDFHYLYSFGFHPTSREYKLVHFLREPQRYKSGQPFHFNTIQVYTLGEDKWRDIRVPRPCCMVNLGVVTVDGSMYWLTEDEETGCGMSVASFDLREETFASIQLPPFEVKEIASCATPKIACYITEIDGKVCIVTIPYQSHIPRWRRYNTELSGRMDIWALESQTEHKWFLKYSIQSPSVHRYVPQPCFIHRERIILQDRDGNAWYHDLAGKNVQIEHREEVKLLDIGAYRFYETQSYFYKETLIPLSVYAGAAIVCAPPRPLAPPVA
ncbi:putative F-box protein At3g17500 [Phragmites australis]|uniref:putative F-box protein At3g17500 n=1 Tax=Phragmites australis TaxID=29695 RepID=UPI002D7A1231|nr:putative F-box protein At3g17500 [Phragmites australis]XP_062199747.1 putative F-box protein At3g17500 [Phragmites australis]